jgi:hypothetical protein
MVFRNVRIIGFQLVALYGWISIYLYIQYYFSIKTKMIINLTTKFNDETQLMVMIYGHVDVDHVVFAKKFEKLNNFG